MPSSRLRPLLTRLATLLGAGAALPHADGADPGAGRSRGPAHRAPRRRAVLEDVEARVLFSADLAPGLLEPQAPDEAQVQSASPPTGTAAASVTARLSFERNEGQVDADIDFLARGSGYQALLSGGDAVLHLQGGTASATLRMHLQGGQADAPVTGESRTATVSHYLVGSQDRWRTGIANFESVRYDGVYDGIDVRYLGNDRQLQYDFLVAAGADAGQIALRFEGARQVAIGADGSLVLTLDDSGRTVSFHAPVTYQDGPQGREAVSSRYDMRADGSIGFVLGDYDRSRALVIDPTLNYGTYFGGSGTDSFNDVAVDAAGNLYGVGSSASAGLATTGQTTQAGSADAVITKYTSAGAVSWVTYWGGAGADVAWAVDVDASGRVYVVGETASATLPGLNGAATVREGTSDAFLLRLAADGSATPYATLGRQGGSADVYRDVWADSPDQVWVTGATGNTGAQQLVVARYDTGQTGASSLSTFKSSYVSSGNTLGQSLAVSGAGEVYVAGTTSAAFTSAAPSRVGQAAFGGGTDGFVLRYDSGLNWVYLSYLGGAGTDTATGLALDGAGRAIVVGTAGSAGLATTGAYDTTFNSTAEGYVAGFDTGLSGSASRAFLTYYGNEAGKTVEASAVAVLPSGRIAITGRTDSSALPLSASAPDNSFGGGGGDAYLAIFSSDVTRLAYATYIGGAGDDRGTALAAGSSFLAVAGSTTAGEVHTAAGADTTPNGSTDGFLQRYAYAAPTLAMTQTTYGATEQVSLDLHGTGLSITDADADALTLTLTSSSSQTQYTVDVGSTGVTLVSGNGSASLVLSGRMQQLNALLGGSGGTLRYRESGDAPPASVTGTWTVAHGAYSTARTFTVNVTAVNDAPVMSNSAPAMSYTENGGAIAIDASLTVGDADHATLGSATIRITGNYVAGQDVLGFVANAAVMGNIVGSFNSATGTMTLTSAGRTATLAQWQAALRTVSYTNTSDRPSTASRVVSFTANDGVADGNTGTKTITVAAVNDAPVVHTSGGSASYTENSADYSGAVAVDPGLTITDLDHDTLSSAVVEFVGGSRSGDWFVWFPNALTGNIRGSTLPQGTPFATNAVSLVSDGNTATLAQWQAALRAVSYYHTTDDPGATPRVIGFRVNDGAADSATATRTVNVTPVNDAPVVTVSGGTTAYTENGGPLVIDSGVTLTDPDNTTLASATVRITGNFVAGQDVLGFVANSGTMGNITGSYNSGTGVLSLSSSGASASLAQWRTALRAVTYLNSSDQPSTLNRTVTYAVSDGAATATSAAKTISVTATNDAPVITTSSGVTTVYTEGSGPQALDTSVTVGDLDHGTLASASVRFVSGYVSGEDVLGLASVPASMGNITGSFNSATGVLTLTSAGATATTAQWQAALRAVSYLNTSEAPATALRQLQFAVNDGTANSAPASKTLQVNAVNDAPTLTPSSATAVYVENGAAVAVDPQLVVGDVDHAALSTATVWISANHAADQDRLIFTPDPATMGAITGSYSSATGVMVLSASGGTASLAQWQAALRAVSYLNSSESPSTLARTVSLSISDGQQTSAVVTRTVDVVAVNDVPVLTTSSGSTAFVENAAGVAIDSGLMVQDVDHGHFASATVRVVGHFVPGQDALGWSGDGSTMGNITAVYDGATGVLSLSSAGATATTVQWQAALRAVTYTNTSDDPDTLDRLVDFRLSDGSLQSPPAMKTVSVTAINDAPAVSLPTTALLAQENGPAVAVAPGLTLTDRDNAQLASARVALQPALPGEDVLALVPGSADFGGITGSFDAATGVLTLSDHGAGATLAQWQAALRAVTYVNTSENPSAATRTVTVVVNDGHSDSAPVSATLTVVAVNDAPVVTTSPMRSEDVRYGAPNIVDANVTLRDWDHAALVSASVAITDHFVPGEDLLTWRGDSLTTGDITGDFDAATGVLSLRSATGATLAQWQAALRLVAYENHASVPTLGLRTLGFSVNDGQFDSAVASIVLGDVDLHDVSAPLDIDSGLNRVAENAAKGSRVGLTVRAVDADARQNAVAYTLVDTAGGRFAIDAVTGEVTVADGARLDRETAALHTLTVQATSADGSFSTQVFSIAVDDVDEVDVTAITDQDDAPQRVQENARAGTLVGITARAVDRDATDSAVRYTLSDSAAGRFVIDPDTGVVSVAAGADLDREATDRQSITVVATSADGSSSRRTFTIELLEVDDHDVGLIEDRDSRPDSISAGALAGTATGIVVRAEDGDVDLNEVRYSLDDSAGGRFRIDPVSGAITVAGGAQLDKEGTDTIRIVVRASSADGSQTLRTFALRIEALPRIETPPAPVWPVLDPQPAVMPVVAAPATPAPAPTPAPMPVVPAAPTAPSAPTTPVLSETLTESSAESGAGGTSSAGTSAGAAGGGSAASAAAGGSAAGQGLPAALMLPQGTSYQLPDISSGAARRLAGPASVGGAEVGGAAPPMNGAGGVVTAAQPGTSMAVVIGLDAAPAAGLSLLATQRSGEALQDDEAAAAVAPTATGAQTLASDALSSRTGQAGLAALSATAAWTVGRTAGLFASLLASAPAWRSVDLLPVLRQTQPAGDGPTEPKPPRAAPLPWPPQAPGDAQADATSERAEGLNGAHPPEGTARADAPPGASRSSGAFEPWAALPGTAKAVVIDVGDSRDA